MLTRRGGYLHSRAPDIAPEVNRIYSLRAGRFSVVSLMTIRLALAGGNEMLGSWSSFAVRCSIAPSSAAKP